MNFLQTPLEKAGLSNGVNKRASDGKPKRFCSVFIIDREKRLPTFSQFQHDLL